MMSRRLALVASTLALAAAGLAPSFANAQGAAKQIMRVISSGAAGSVSDMLARPVAAALTTSDTAVVVENRPGSGGFLAINELMRSPADGATMMLFSAATISWNRQLYKRLPYDPADIVPVSPLAAIPMMLAVKPTFPASNLQDFINAARKAPRQYSYGFGGNGGAAHVSFARFAAATGVDLMPVAYKSGPPALQDLMGGYIDAMLDGVPLLEPQVKAGKLRALAVATKTRLPSLPDVPTIAESGYPDFEAVIWVGMAVKKGTPVETINKLNARITAALQSPAVRDAYGRAGAIVRLSGVREFTEFVESEDKLWTHVLQKARISID